MTRELFDPAIVALAVASLLVTATMAATIHKPFQTLRVPGPSGIFLLVLAAVSAALGAAFSSEVPGAVLSFGVLWACFAACHRLLPKLTAPGAALTAMPIATFLLSAPWGYFLLQENGFPDWTLYAYLGGTILGLLVMPYVFLVRLAEMSLFTHQDWSRPNAPLDGAGTYTPKVSIHVPCYAEPPEVVIATLRALRDLEYQNYEVIVCDNNTSDPTLWEPLRDACEQFNRSIGHERFRFFHVAPLQGAKAGALNFCLTKTPADVELIALVDADYIAQPDFLSRLVGFFRNPKVGFVQTSHDYRDSGESTYKNMCYWEYMPAYKCAIPSLNEYDSAYTVGTMCLFRRSTLEAIGGWAEWCLTEDSEVAVRFRAAGFEGVFLRDTFGRGLIPERFIDYKKQRFRWTAGPLQQLRRHWRLYLPRWLSGQDSGMRPWAKLLELHHSLEALVLLGMPLALLSGILLGGLIASGSLPTIDLPGVAWAVLALGVATQALRLWLKYRLADAQSLSEIIGGIIASQSLMLVRIQATAAGLFSARPLEWRRTPKFDGQTGSFIGAIRATAPETAVGVTLLALATVPMWMSDALGPDLTALGTVGLVILASRFLCAPLFAMLREVELRRTSRSRSKNGTSVSVSV